jgi:hypothetical protein
MPHFLSRYPQVGHNRRILHPPDLARVPASYRVRACSPRQAWPALCSRHADPAGGFIARESVAAKEPRIEKGSVVSAALREPAAHRTESVEVTKPPLFQGGPSLASVWTRRFTGGLSLGRSRRLGGTTPKNVSRWVNE